MSKSAGDMPMCSTCYCVWSLYCTDMYLIIGFLVHALSDDSRLTGLIWAATALMWRSFAFSHFHLHHSPSKLLHITEIGLGLSLSSSEYTDASWHLLTLKARMSIKIGNTVASSYLTFNIILAHSLWPWVHGRGVFMTVLSGFIMVYDDCAVNT